MANPRCFISYSWDSDSHKDWVRSFAEQLEANGVEVLLDQWDVRPGADLPAYMETSVREADFVLLICTPTFAQKANAGTGGVGYEKTIVTGEVFLRTAAPEKFVPLLVRGDSTQSLPSYLKSKVFLDFRTAPAASAGLEQLLRHVFDEPRFVRPPRGVRPVFQPSATSQPGPAAPGTAAPEIRSYCGRCGAVPGKPTQCTGGSLHHEFVRSACPSYCTRCGTVPRMPSQCTGGYLHHSFTASPGRAYCRRCGAEAGKTTECTGGYSHHDFVAWYVPVYCFRCGAFSGAPTLCTGGYSHHDFVPQ